MSHAERDMRQELYLSLALLGADPLLLGTLATWANGAADDEVLGQPGSKSGALRRAPEEDELVVPPKRVHAGLLRRTGGH